MKQLVKLWERPSNDGKKFRYYLLYTDEQGKRRQKTLGHSDRRKAERQRAQFERKLSMGILEPDSMKLRDFMTDSLARTGDQIRESTRVDYREAMETFISIVGNMDYRMVQHTHGEFFRQACLDRGDRPATVVKKLKELKRFFTLAVQRKQLGDNPLQYIRLPKVQKPKIRVYTDDELDHMLKIASQFQNEAVLEWDMIITLAITTGMRKSELLNLVWTDIDFGEMVIDVTPKETTTETWEWKIKDTDHRVLPLKEDVSQLLIELQDRRPEGYPYVLVPPGRYDHIQQKSRPSGNWTLSDARNSVINNFTRQFNKILAMAHVKKGTFHDIRKTAITNWFGQDLTEYDVMTLAGHANFATTHKFYLAVADDLIARARKATTHQVSQELLQKCCQDSQKGAML
jgi:integrase